MLRGFLKSYLKRIKYFPHPADVIYIFWQTLQIITGPGRCKFIPSCSQYSKEAFKRYGLFKGFVLSFKRILRCNPLSKGGYDPLP